MPGLPNRPVAQTTALDPDRWLFGIFSSKAAREGGVIRRSLRDVERIYGLEAFRREIERRGFTAITDGRQIVIFCHAERIRRFA
ncbi:MAG: hypothetical protein ACU0BS_06000 [Hasllibacter sp.]